MSTKRVTKTPEIPIGKDSNVQTGRLKAMGGSQSDQWNETLAGQAVLSLWTKNSDSETSDKQLEGVLAALQGIGPKDELEGMMAAQLIAAHNATMECLRRAMIGEQTFEGRSENLSQANKLSRTFATLIEALNRYRGKGQQKVIVEHVHVHAGGQAVVGMVAAPGKPGGGDANKFEEQPHAKQIAHAPEPAMPRPDPEPDVLPVTSNGKRALSDARRQGTGRRQGQ